MSNKYTVTIVANEKTYTVSRTSSFYYAYAAIIFDTAKNKAKWVTGSSSHAGILKSIAKRGLSEETHGLYVVKI